MIKRRGAAFGKNNMIELAVNETNYRYFMIEAIAEVGCGYVTMCLLVSRCGRNKEVIVARVASEEADKIEALVQAWFLKSEEPCQLEGNYLNGKAVDIQHYRAYNARS